LRTKFKNIKKDVNEILDATRRYVKALSGKNYFAFYMIYVIFTLH